MPFQIRPEQMNVFAEHSEKDFHQRMAAHLREDFPEQTQNTSVDELDAFVRKWTADAQSHELEYECEVEEYLNLCVMFPALTVEPRAEWILDILDYPDRSSERKLRFLYERLAIPSLENRQ
jgi:hypothetical protein